MKPLTERERRFVEAFMGSAAGNATDAAKRAGYSAKSARFQGSRLATKRNIQDAIAERQKADPLVADRVERQQFWTAVQRNPDVPWKDRLRASELAGKAGGDFVDLHEITGKDGGPVRVQFVDVPA